MKTNAMKKAILGLMIATSLSACSSVSERIANIGKAPDMAPIVNPQTQPGYKPVTMPMPAPEIASQQPNSLWQSNRKSFFKDQRATSVGDILTVTINITDKAEFKNDTTRQRVTGESAGIPSLLGLESKFGQVLPKTVNPASLLAATSNSSTVGTGDVKREEDVTVKLAVVISQILPNGNMVVGGKQEVLVNYEKRILSLAGIIRPEDISVDNTIGYEKVAEARISYGGVGQEMDISQPRYGDQLFDILMPF